MGEQLTMPPKLETLAVMNKRTAQATEMTATNFPGGKYVKIAAPKGWNARYPR